MAYINANGKDKKRTPGKAHTKQPNTQISHSHAVSSRVGSGYAEPPELVKIINMHYQF